MLTLLSPSKTLDFNSTRIVGEPGIPQFLKNSEILIKELHKLSQKNIAKLMDISPKLAELNFDRYKNFTTPFTTKNARQCILAFKGDVYDGLDADSFNKKDFEIAQEKIRILSGLYGLLKPMDLMQPYRLEMGIKLKNPKGKNLYDFWDDAIANAINKELSTHESKFVVNLASEEYFAAVKPDKLKDELINIVFKEKKGTSYKVIGLIAKKSRGMMARFIVQNKIENINDLQKFSEGGYRFNKAMSTDSEFVFTR